VSDMIHKMKELQFDLFKQTKPFSILSM